MCFILIPVAKQMVKVEHPLMAHTLYLDSCSQADGKGGTSADGPHGCRFFSQDVVPVLKELCIKRYINYLFLLQVSVILRMISSSRKVSISSFQKLCVETSINIAENFLWV